MGFLKGPERGNIKPVLARRGNAEASRMGTLLISHAQSPTPRTSHAHKPRACCRLVQKPPSLVLSGCALAFWMPWCHGFARELPSGAAHPSGLLTLSAFPFIGSSTVLRTQGRSPAPSLSPLGNPLICITLGSGPQETIKIQDPSRVLWHPLLRNSHSQGSF